MIMRRGSACGKGSIGTPPHIMDLHERLEKLRADATDAAIIRDLATHPEQRILYTRLADHLTRFGSGDQANSLAPAGVNRT
jgi:hypothetical protein